MDFDDNINDRDSDFNANESPIKSQISNKFDNKPVQVAKPRTQAAPPSSSQTINPILGFSESDPKRKKFKDEYSEYVKNGLKEDKEKIRSKSRRNNSGGYIRDDASQSNYHNEYAQKQRYQHSYFKYGSSNPILQNNPTPSPYSDKLYMKENSVNNQYDDRFSKIGGQRHNGSVDDRAMQGGSLRRDYSPAKSIVSIIPDNRDAQIDKEQKQKALAEELKSQMLLKEQQKQKEKEAIKNQEYKNMQEFIYNNPFGRMGAGAPIRDSQGHIVANRMKLFDPEATSFQQSFYNNRQDINPSHFDMTDHKKKSIQNLNDSDIGLQFLEWSNQERRRKDMKMDEWKRALDEQSNLTKKKKQDGK